MKRSYVVSIVLVSCLMLLVGIAPAQNISTGKLPTAKVFLSVETLVVDDDGIHPLTGARRDLTELNDRGATHQIIQLGESLEHSLHYVLEYTLLDDGRISLKLQRTLNRGSRKEELPSMARVISPLGSWNTTVLEDTGRGGRIELRVVPVLREQAVDETFDARSIGMNVSGGPLVQFGETDREHRVIFREVNVGGRGSGLSLGLPGVGVAKLHFQPFPGAEEVGWVRGRTLHFELDGKRFQIWSTETILPEDRGRPGKGWVLYGLLEPDAGLDRGHYGGFPVNP